MGESSGISMLHNKKANFTFCQNLSFKATYVDGVCVVHQDCGTGVLAETSVDGRTLMLINKI